MKTSKQFPQVESLHSLVQLKRQKVFLGQFLNVQLESEVRNKEVVAKELLPKSSKKYKFPLLSYSLYHSYHIY